MGTGYTRNDSANNIADVIFKLDEGKYMIDLVESFKKFTDKVKAK